MSVVWTAFFELNAVFLLLALAASVATLAYGNGAAFVAAAVLYGLVYGVFNAWVLLVEILR
ncbi:MAG TPA: hypothetical protein VMA98_09240 [Candidatus Acidoferrales bacterium]|nr:hypothetical protein [Candidatus Acidoferrales bacterium]